MQHNTIPATKKLQGLFFGIQQKSIQEVQYHNLLLFQLQI